MGSVLYTNEIRQSEDHNSTQSPAEESLLQEIKSGGQKVKRNRIPLSCEFCRKRKAKCDRQRPYCGTCARNDKKTECVYVQAVQKKKSSRKRRTSNISEKSNTKPKLESNPSIVLPPHFNISPLTKLPDIGETTSKAPNLHSLIHHYVPPLKIPETGNTTNLSPTFQTLRETEHNGLEKSGFHQLLMETNNSFATTPYISQMSEKQFVGSPFSLNNYQNSSRAESRTGNKFIEKSKYGELYHSIGIDENSKIDFYESFNSMLCQQEKIINYGPLAWMSLIMKDPFCRPIREEVMKHKENMMFLTKRDDGTNSKFLMSLGFDDNKEIDISVSVGDKINFEMNSSENCKSPFSGMYVKATNIISQKTSDDKYLLYQILLVLPCKKAIWLLIDRFFTHVYPVFPYLDQFHFISDVEMILKESKYLNPESEEIVQTLDIHKKLDFSTLGILLLVLKLAESSYDDTAEDEKDSSYKFLQKYKLSDDIVTVAEMCLDKFNILNKCAFPVFQLALLLRHYEIYSGSTDVSNPGGHILISLLIQLATSLGLNRDPSKMDFAMSNGKMGNLWRKIWYGLVSIDTKHVMLFGNGKAISEEFYDTQLPSFDEASSNIDDLELEREVIEKIKLNYQYDKLCSKLACYTCSLKKTPNVSKVLGCTDLCTTLTYLLPVEWTETMICLQSECPESTVEDIKQMFENDTGIKFDNYFSHFDSTPIGVASLAQVHKATLRETGQEVAVKLQHPSLAKFVPLDVALTKFVFDMMYKVFPDYPLTWLGDEMQESIFVELDFRYEAKNAKKTQDYFKEYLSSTALKVPEVYTAKRRVLIMEFIGGARLDNLNYIDGHHISRAEVCGCLAHIFNNMIFKSGFVHCDPHHGNIAIRHLDQPKNGHNFEIILYDHGLYRTIPNQMKVDYSKFWLALIDKNQQDMKVYGKKFAKIDDNQFPLFAAAITGRDFDHALQGDLEVPRSQEEIDKMRNTMMDDEMVLDLMSLLATVPRIVLLILKTNDLVRHLDQSLQSPLGQERTFVIMAKYCAETVYKDDLIVNSRIHAKWSIPWITETGGGTFSGSNYFQESRKNGPKNGDRTNNTQIFPKPNSQQQNNFNKITRDNRKKFGVNNEVNGDMRHRSTKKSGKDSSTIKKFQNNRKNFNEQNQKLIWSDKSSKLKESSYLFANNSLTTSSERDTIITSDSPKPTTIAVTDTNSFEKKLFGNLLKTPDKFGFHKLKRKSLKVPKYMLKENVLFSMNSFQRNNWDFANQQMLTRREQEYTGEPQLLYEEFQEHRKQEREMMERLNFVDKENAKKSLDDAIVFRGSCEDMCPVYERVERLYKNQVSQWEKDPLTSKISREYAIKTFMRPSGQAPPLPSDVRPPNVLQKTLDYIIETLVPRLPESQSFIWDRTRSIRQDFTFQNNYSGFESIDCHEKICRIHILSLHVMAGANDPDYQQQQEVEQFNNSLQTLTHMYDDVRSRGGFCPNEPEFRAYELISKIKDTELDRHIQTLPDHILKEPILQRAIMLRGLVFEGIDSINLFSEFFKAIINKRTTFLLASLAEIHFNEIRYTALRALSRAYHSKAKKLPAVLHLVEMLQYNNVNELMDTCKLYELPIIKDQDTSTLLVDVTQMKSAYKSTQKQVYTKAIDHLTNGLSMPEIIKSGHSNSELSLNKPRDVEQVARESFKASRKNTEVIENILLHGASCNFTVSIDTSATNFLVPNQVKSFTNNNTDNSLFLEGNFNISQSDQTVPSTWINEENEDRSESNNVVVKQKVYDRPVSSDTLLQETSLPKNETDQDIRKLMVENPNFNKEAMMFLNTVAIDVVKDITKKILVQQLVEEQKRRDLLKKDKVLSKICNELFAAFMKEQVYLVALEARAILFHQLSLKKIAFYKLVRFAEKISHKKELDKIKTTEINSFIEHVSAPYIPPYHVPVPDQKVILTSKAKLEIHKIFEELNPPRNEVVYFVLRSPKSVFSRLILNQFGLFDSKSIEYKSQKGSILKLKILPDRFDSKELFSEVTTLLVQVGTVEGIDTSKRSTLIRCLIKDARVLKKLVSYLNLFSTKKKFSIIICYLDVYNHRLSYHDIKAFLDLDHLKSPSVVIGFVRLNSAVPNQLGSIKKVHDELMSITKALWSKTGRSFDASHNSSTDTINLVPGNNNTLNTSNLSIKNLNVSSDTIKRKFSYIEKVVGCAADKIERKKKKFQTDMSTRMRAHITSRESTEILKPNDSLMLLRRAYLNTSINSIGSSFLRPNDNFDDSNESNTRTTFKDKIEELEELDQLAETVLKS
ncbi:hypothetical protein CANINC_001760 [Pichia inconspicua]|uniref:Zn(2)-C6 fungal-type domain-containing protein n=1 Tax=Pichia inconspicua TaxID=52247 RepID=A0A4T0X2U7_9ASCO|nr:hypothetical protein CANINC_001760 [[Candida] inconspicua]